MVKDNNVDWTQNRIIDLFSDCAGSASGGTRKPRLSTGNPWCCFGWNESDGYNSLIIIMKIYRNSKFDVLSVITHEKKLM